MLRFGGVKRELFGFDPHTTNNRMELMAAIQGLLALKEPCEVEIATDSEYVFLGMTERISKWKQRQWWHSKHVPVPNVDLWIELDELASLHKPAWAYPGERSRRQRPVRLVGTECGSHSEKFLAGWKAARPLRRNLGVNYVPPAYSDDVDQCEAELRNLEDEAALAAER
jgi:hypothetical protein